MVGSTWRNFWRSLIPSSSDDCGMDNSSGMGSASGTDSGGDALSFVAYALYVRCMPRLGIVGGVAMGVAGVSQ